MGNKSNYEIEVIVNKPLSDKAIKNMVTYLFELIEEKNIYDKIK